VPKPPPDPVARRQLEARTLCEAFHRTATEHPDRTALTTLGGPEISWSEYRRRSERLAGALAARGVGRGETVALMMSNRTEFFLLDMAALLCGGTPLAIYNTSPPEEIAYILDDSRPRLIFTEVTLEPVVRQAVALARHAEPQVVTLGAVEDAGDARELNAFERGGPTDFDVDARWRAVRPDDVALVIYTSGTTGRPKGVQLSHRNLMASWYAFVMHVPQMAHLERLISYLPAAHLADRVFSVYPAIHTGAAITCVPDRRRIGEALATVRPSTFLGVPRIWEKLRAALEPTVGARPTPEAAARARERLGFDEGTVVWTGSAPLDVEVLEFFDALGLPILEGYGMTEATAVICTNRVDDRRLGTVGPAMPGIEVAVADDGEILVRGDNVMVGYRNLPEATAEAVDPDGWLHTGDVGTLDADGYLTIVDRKKELIINSSGKNISPANIENALRSACHVLGPVAAIGDRRPYVTALLTLDPDESRAWATARGLPGSDIAALATRPELRAHIAEAVERANERLARTSQVKNWTVLDEVWQPESGLVTPTLKLKRRAILQRYPDLIDSLYDIAN
jgi:long-subunit acyl-CoA synthetase (AMP-forming)